MILTHSSFDRPVHDPAKSAEIYSNGLELEILDKFTDNGGNFAYKVGLKNLFWHFEFTQFDDPPTTEEIFVFYVMEKERYTRICASMRQVGFAIVNHTSIKPTEEVTTYQDPDGYRVNVHLTTWNGAGSIPDNT